MGLAAAVGLTTAVAFSTTAILTSVAVVGAVVGVVGAITKNPILSDIGLGLGLVGGVGALASAALGGSEAALFGTSTAASTTDAAGGAALTATSTVAPDAVGGLTDTSPWLDTTAGSGGGLVDPTVAASASPAVTNASAPVIDNTPWTDATPGSPPPSAAASPVSGLSDTTGAGVWERAHH